jgi:hypothetical protein
VRERRISSRYVLTASAMGRCCEQRCDCLTRQRQCLTPCLPRSVPVAAYGSGHQRRSCRPIRGCACHFPPFNVIGTFRVTFLTTIHDHDVLLDATIAGEHHWAIALSLWCDDALRDVDFSVEHVAFGAGITLGITGRQLPDYKGNGAEEGTRTPTPLRAHGPEPCASANSATSARHGAADLFGSRVGSHHFFRGMERCQTRASRPAAQLDLPRGAALIGRLLAFHGRTEAIGRATSWVSGFRWQAVGCTLSRAAHARWGLLLKSRPKSLPGCALSPTT